MPYCCVPLCKSQTGKTTNISFHEIPSNLHLREQWLKAISRKNWIPNSNSNYSRVCSLHFNSDDFIVGGKYKRLKPNATPSVFKNYPSCMVKAKKKPQLTNHILQHAESSEFVYSGQRSTSRASEHLQDVAGTNILTGNTDQEFLEVDLETPKSEDEAVQVHFSHDSKLSEVNQWKNRYRYLLTKMKKLQQKLTASEEKVQKLETDKNINMFRKVITAAEDNEIHAIFILNQVKNFTS